MKGRAILTSVGVMIALLGKCNAKAQSPGSKPPAADCASDPQLPSFEVAAIRPAAPKERFTSIGHHGLLRFDMKGVTLSLLLSFSFEVQPENFIGAPAGLDNEVFDIQVEPAGRTPLTYEVLKPRMQKMLEQRFCLKAHFGTKEASGYDLVVAKAGPKLRLKNSQAERSAFISADELVTTNSELPVIASLLTSAAGLPVKDDTGLQGAYAVKLEFAPGDDPSSSLPSIFTAVKEQLGLKLKPTKVPVRTMTIDHLYLIPTEN